MTAKGQINDADVFLLRVKANDLLGLSLHGADEQIRDAADLKNRGDFGVFLDIDAIEIDCSLIMVGDIAQDGFQPAARAAPVGIKVHHNGTLTLHDPITGVPVGNHVLEPCLVNRMDGIDGVYELRVVVIT